MADWVLSDTCPSAEEYIRIRKAAGCTREQGLEAARAGLPNSFFALTVRSTETGEAIGMGRIVGDHGLFHQVTDIAVDKTWQGKGIGRAIMDRIAKEIDTKVPKGGYISLMADGTAWKMYEKYGFQLAAPGSLGMYRCV